MPLSISGTITQPDVRVPVVVPNSQYSIPHAHPDLVLGVHTPVYQQYEGRGEAYSPSQPIALSSPLEIPLAHVSNYLRHRCAPKLGFLLTA